MPANVLTVPCGPTNSTPSPPGALIPEFPWVPGMTVAAAAATAGWVVKEKRSTARTPVGAEQPKDEGATLTV
jgi:hypothetical protein